MKKEIIFYSVVALLMTFFFRSLVFVVVKIFGNVSEEFILNNTAVFVWVIFVLEIAIPFFVTLALYRLLSKIYLGEIKLQKVNANLILIVVTLLFLGYNLLPILVDLSPFGYGSMSTYSEGLLYRATPFYR